MQRKEKEKILTHRKGMNSSKRSITAEDVYLRPYEMECIKRANQEYKEGKTIKVKDINNIWESIM